MKSQSSGINIWLQQAMTERLGDEQAQQIISEAKKHGDKRYIYIIGVLDALGHKDIGMEYRERINADQRARHRTLKMRHLAGYQKQLETCTDPQRAVRLRGRIQKIEEYLKKEEERENS